ncbi:hypothetical protein DPMN_183899 [Dreissena polymorpha]|uniref:Uncharacterized protein n=1 Tax=Dreissena polymorpha TaxID=45954 RepID=A0A9D4DGU9_DREPO|nr:hypothetical protein DPMN_183899 [Dreissena polymorpha]
MNVDTGAELEYLLPEGSSVQEPQFIPYPGEIFEDDGVILSQGFDGIQRKGFDECSFEESCFWKTWLNACSLNVVPDQHVHSAQANQERQFLWYFSLTGSFFFEKIHCRRKLSSLINMCGIYIWNDTVRPRIKPSFFTRSHCSLLLPNCT